MYFGVPPPLRREMWKKHGRGEEGFLINYEFFFLLSINMTLFVHIICYKFNWNIMSSGSNYDVCVNTRW